MIECILALIAWCRGWSFGKAVIPIGLAIMIGLLSGIVCLTLNIQMPVLLLFGIDVCIWIWQITMIIDPPSKEEIQSSITPTINPIV